jgi:hypothetical protein
MRKIIAASIFLVFSFFAQSVFAEVTDDCLELKSQGAPKGLYGLCIAYNNAENGKSQERLAELFDKKAEGTDYVGFLTGGGCPCWTDAQIEDAYCNMPLTMDEVGPNSILLEFIGFHSETNNFQFLIFEDVSSEPSYCFSQINSTGTLSETTVVQSLQCTQDLVDVLDGTLDVDC